MVTPVERIRQSNNIRALRLFIDLYHAHDLINGPGINWRPPHGLRFKYERVQLGQFGEFVVWDFKPLHSEVYTAAPFCELHLGACHNKVLGGAQDPDRPSARRPRHLPCRK